MRLMETSPAEKDPSPTLDIIFYYLVIYPSFLKALGSYCCQSRGMKAPARTSISEITPFWRQRQDGGRNKEAMLLGGTFIIEWQIVEQSASLGAKWCCGRQCLLFLGWIEMGLELQIMRDIHSISKYNFSVTDSVIWKAWSGGEKHKFLWNWSYFMLKYTHCTLAVFPVCQARNEQLKIISFISRPLFLTPRLLVLHSFLLLVCHFCLKVFF